MSIRWSVPLFALTLLACGPEPEPAAPPGPGPGGPPGPGPAHSPAQREDPLVTYNLQKLNAIRSQRGLAPLTLDARLGAFALAASQRLSRDHSPHAHFIAGAKGESAFGGSSGENQGDPRGVGPMDADPMVSGQKQVDELLRLMMSEGRGGGHHDNIVNPRFKRVGIGILHVGGTLYLTNDFSE